MQQRTNALHIYDNKQMSKCLNTTYISCPESTTSKKAWWLLPAGTLAAYVRRTNSIESAEWCHFNAMPIISECKLCCTRISPRGRHALRAVGNPCFESMTSNEIYWQIIRSEMNDTIGDRFSLIPGMKKINCRAHPSGTNTEPARTPPSTRARLDTPAP